MMALSLKKSLFLLLLASAVLAGWDEELDTVLDRLTQAAYASAYDESLEVLLPLLQPDGSFSDLKYGEDDSTSFITHGKRQSSLAFHHVNGEDLTREIVSSFAFVTYDAPDNTDSNWWGHVIGVPYKSWMGATLARDLLSQELMTDYLDRYWVNTPAGPVWDTQEHSEQMSGGNLAPRAMLGEVEGLLRGTYAEVHKEVQEAMFIDLALRQPYDENGFRPDGCLHQHNILGDRATGDGYLEHNLGNIYNSAYGRELLVHTSNLFSWYTGTSMDFENATIEGLFGAYLECQQWLFRGHTSEPTTCGRHLTDEASKPDLTPSAPPQGDGFLTVLVDSEEYGKPKAEVFLVYDWARVPGVTNVYTKDIPQYLTGTYKAERFFNNVTYSGGVSDGMVGAVAMTTNRPYEPLRHLKSWFFFDDVIVALASDVTLGGDDVTGESVVTTLAQLAYNGTYVIGTASGEEASPGWGSHEEAQPTWLHHRSVGYVFLNGDEQLITLADTRAHGEDEIDVFTAWLDHGPSPEGAGHAYAVLPAADVDKTRLFAAEPDVEVLSRTASLHAVCHGPSQTIGAAFVQAGELTSSCGPSAEVSLLVDTPCLALVSVSSESADAAELSVTLADPQQMYDVIRIRVTYGGREAEQTVQMPFPPLRGSSVTVAVSV
ncbi:xanthan lyase isoform X2 [Penaeus vannamei]|uniref:xanthan lyase isoform X2 n=1 Tax=Penaeus vannamei TaxID=6689 RepID=UPI00387F6DEE